MVFTRGNWWLFTVACIMISAVECHEIQEGQTLAIWVDEERVDILPYPITFAVEIIEATQTKTLRGVSSGTFTELAKDNAWFYTANYSQIATISLTNTTGDKFVVFRVKDVYFQIYNMDVVIGVPDWEEIEFGSEFVWKPQGLSRMSSTFGGSQIEVINNRKMTPKSVGPIQPKNNCEPCNESCMCDLDVTEDTAVGILFILQRLTVSNGARLMANTIIGMPDSFIINNGSVIVEQMIDLMPPPPNVNPVDRLISINHGDIFALGINMYGQTTITESIIEATNSICITGNEFENTIPAVSIRNSELRAGEITIDATGINNDALLYEINNNTLLENTSLCGNSQMGVGIKLVSNDSHFSIVDSSVKGCSDSETGVLIEANVHWIDSSELDGSSIDGTGIVFASQFESQFMDLVLNVSTTGCPSMTIASAIKLTSSIVTIEEGPSNCANPNVMINQISNTRITAVDSELIVDLLEDATIQNTVFSGSNSDFIFITAKHVEVIGSSMADASMIMFVIDSFTGEHDVHMTFIDNNIVNGTFTSSFSDFSLPGFHFQGENHFSNCQFNAKASNDGVVTQNPSPVVMIADSLHLDGSSFDITTTSTSLISFHATSQSTISFRNDLELIVEHSGAGNDIVFLDDTIIVSEDESQLLITTTGESTIVSDFTTIQNGDVSLRGPSIWISDTQILVNNLYITKEGLGEILVANTMLSFVECVLEGSISLRNNHYEILSTENCGLIFKDGEFESTVNFVDNFNIQLHCCNMLISNSLTASGDFFVERSPCLGSSTVSITKAGATIEGALDLQHNGDTIIPQGVTASSITLESTTATLCGSFTAENITIQSHTVGCSSSSSLSFNASQSISLAALDEINTLDISAQEVEFTNQVGVTSPIGTLSVTSNEIRFKENAEQVITENFQVYQSDSLPFSGAMKLAVSVEFVVLDAQTAITLTGFVLLDAAGRVSFRGDSNLPEELTVNSPLVQLYSGTHNVDATVNGDVTLFPQAILRGSPMIQMLTVGDSGATIIPTEMNITQARIFDPVEVQMNLISINTYPTLFVNNFERSSPLGYINLTVSSVFPIEQSVEINLIGSLNHFENIVFKDVNGLTISNGSEIDINDELTSSVFFVDNPVGLVGTWLSLRNPDPSASPTPSLVSSPNTRTNSPTPQSTIPSASIIQRTIVPPVDVSIASTPTALLPIQIPSNSLSQTRTVNANCLIGGCPAVGSSFEAPQQAPSGATIVASLPDPELIATSDTSNVVSVIIDFNLEDPNAELGGNVELCFRPLTNDKNLCLGFLNESKMPPKWECEDICLVEDDDGFVCGETDHFTNFALLLTGARNRGSDPCNSSTDYVTDSWWGDLILVGSCFLLLICFGAVVIILGTLVTPVSKIVYGKEGYRIQKTRKAGTHIVATGNTDNP